MTRVEMGAKLQRRFVDQRWSKPSLALKTGYSYHTIHKVLTGGNTHWQTVLDVAAALGAEVSIGDLAFICIADEKKSA